VKNYTLINSIKTNKRSSVLVKRFYYGMNKFNCILISGVLLLALLGSYYYGEFSTFVPKTLNYEQRIKDRYENAVALFKGRGKKFDQTYNEYYEDVVYRYKEDLIFIAITHTSWLIPFLIFLFWRQPPPICFDRDKKLIYTWHFGKLYIATFDQLKPKCLKSHFTSISYSFGPLEVSLYNSVSKKEKRFKLGGYFAIEGQNAQLAAWLKQFMQYGVENESYYSEKNTWLKNSVVEKSLLPARELPKEKFEQALNALHSPS
jgi:hypothetical protein